MATSAVLFDCDGVLVNSEELGVEIELEHLSNIGLEYKREEYHSRFLGLPDPVYLKALDRDSRDILNRPLPLSFAQDLHTARLAAFREKLQAIQGIADLLDGLKIPIAVVSSSTATGLREKLQLTNLIQYFDPHLYSTDLVKNGKPAPDLFLLAASTLGVHPNSCLVVEDSENGVRAGVGAGMTVWGFTGGGHADKHLGRRLLAAGATRVFNRFDAVRYSLMIE